MYPEEDELDLLGQDYYLFLKYCYFGFMICYYTYFPCKTIMAKFFETMQYTQCLSVLLYLCSALLSLLPSNAMGLRVVMSGATSFGHVLPSLVYNRMAPSPISDVSVLRHRGLVSLQNFMHTSAFIKDFVLSYMACVM